MCPEKLLSLAHRGMLVSLVLSLIAVGVGYFFYHGLSLFTQLVAHMMLIILPVVFKVSYIARLTALNMLGRPVN